MSIVQEKAILLKRPKVNASQCNSMIQSAVTLDAFQDKCAAKHPSIINFNLSGVAENISKIFTC